MPDATDFPTGNNWREKRSFVDQAGDYWIEWEWAGPDQTVEPYYRKGETVFDCHPQPKEAYPHA